MRSAVGNPHGIRLIIQRVKIENGKVEKKSFNVPQKSLIGGLNNYVYNVILSDDKNALCLYRITHAADDIYVILWYGASLKIISSRICMLFVLT